VALLPPSTNAAYRGSILAAWFLALSSVTTIVPGLIHYFLPDGGAGVIGGAAGGGRAICSCSASAQHFVMLCWWCDACSRFGLRVSGGGRDGCRDVDGGCVCNETTQARCAICMRGSRRCTSRNHTPFSARLFV
jgi:hypothetical protein